MAFLLAGAGLGLHLGVGIGNGLDVTAADVLDHLAAGPATRRAVRSPKIAGVGGPRARGLHVEGVTDGRRLVEAVERLTEHVPVVALVVGRNDVGDLARSHTGALTPAWRTARAALRAAGAVLVDDERETGRRASWRWRRAACPRWPIPASGSSPGRPGRRCCSPTG